jgi:hypothetical protein
MELLRSVAGYTRKGQTKHTKITEGLNIQNPNSKIPKSKSQWKCHALRTEDGRISKAILTDNPKR